MREWRKKHPLTGGAKKRDIARSYAYEYMKRGKLKAAPCQVCGDAVSEMHHPDHELPLQVAWLCRDHHLAWHSFWREASAHAWESWSDKMADDHRVVEKTKD